MFTLWKYTWSTEDNKCSTETGLLRCVRTKSKLYYLWVVYIQSHCKDDNRCKHLPGDTNDVNLATRLPQTDLRLNRVFRATRAETSHDALSRKPINEEFIDTSDWSRKCFLLILCFYLREWRQKRLVSNLERVTPCKYLLCFWCAVHTPLVHNPTPLFRWICKYELCAFLFPLTQTTAWENSS